MAPKYTIESTSFSWQVLCDGETFITTHATKDAEGIARQIASALNAQEEGASCIEGEHRNTINRFLAYYNDPTSPGECQKMADAVRALIGGLAAATMHAKATSDRLMRGELHGGGVMSALRVSIAYRLANGDDGSHSVVEGSRDAVIDAIQGTLGARNASKAWATDTHTGQLIAGFDYDGRVLTEIPTTLNSFADTDMRVYYPPHARIVDPIEQHAYKLVRGFCATVLVFIDGRCVGFADPEDLGYEDAEAMRMAGVAS
jgi:hypothetical protein